MNIPVKITVGCEIVYFKEKTGYFESIVTSINGNFITVEGPAVVHIKEIIQFTFGGVWVANRKYNGNGWPILHFRP